ncbi:6-phosphogluconolactonase [Homoserinibacter sp. GY 40078]|uniref:6-phosphogluconolactonase n=1 Tax=Homoserinibacter sp. GY 40078 TaxID=2603275 RepID=UPI0011C87B8C|nr:6-phosphogluconolactonase [Homoserinibacter sp. GY 40078]TXK18905.1 hypothetical protein FVQ89_02915 [Homoserinibacter sp. GY 40078]
MASTPPIVLPDREAVGRAVAERIADGIEHAITEGRRYLLGCPTGRTPDPVYTELERLVRERGLDLSGVAIVLMDEYVVPDGDGLALVDADLPHSCVGYAERRILGPLTAAAEAGGHRGPQLWHADPADPAAYDERIREAGGVDLFILAAGSGDGHLAFNPPGSARDSITRIVDLAEQTRRDNLLTFPSFDSLDDVPHQGISVGIATIIELSSEVVMILTGDEKRRSFARILAADAYEPDWPATAYAEAAHGTLIADTAAAAG